MTNLSAGKVIMSIVPDSTGFEDELRDQLANALENIAESIRTSK